ncbi:methionine ABC transporter ATP-binding protein [Ilyobacter polytropus]|uniref:ABC transporter related protein n=1 Tax=Ilyobacter polytropus (strain ATCC 51220 / DSM 2926 / LMG 16218 / CuHBu1) TaxID=572544 RepID=E3H8J3_ILYPC|nr:ATP-binding cassette domain-containing protein [Ilyobacter polytropus]ADO82975.1 ABC transporter related protein [Ilyobacter polytropus DSM 2926]
MIEIKDLNKLYSSAIGDVLAVKNVNLNIKEDDIYGIMGLSGAGKSTLIRLLNRLEEPSSGEILVEGNNILKFNDTELKEYRKKTGMIFQHFNLLQSRDVFGNIAFALEIAGWDKNDIPSRVKELLTLVELEDKERAFPSQLSGGQKQRVAIARALANNPKILLSDEATSALDPKTTKSILDLLKDLQKKLGLTIVLITHQMEVIRSVCNRAAIMDKGEVIEEGSVDRIFSNPRTEMAKEFISHLIPEETEEVDFVKSPGKKIIKLSYIGHTVEKPVISQMVRMFDIDANIVSGSIDKLVTQNVGHLILELSGERQEEALNWIKKEDVEIKVIYNG